MADLLREIFYIRMADMIGKPIELDMNALYKGISVEIRRAKYMADMKNLVSLSERKQKEGQVTNKLHGEKQ